MTSNVRKPKKVRTTGQQLRNETVRLERLYARAWEAAFVRSDALEECIAIAIVEAKLAALKMRAKARPRRAHDARTTARDALCFYRGNRRGVAVHPSPGQITSVQLGG